MNAARLLGVSYSCLPEPDRKWLVEHRWMTCADCGRFYPWAARERRKFWPNSTYVCWPCSIAERQKRAKPDPRWWRWFARHMRVNWDFPAIFVQ